jgi:hypothetical protein
LELEKKGETIKMVSGHFVVTLEQLGNFEEFRDKLSNADRNKRSKSALLTLWLQHNRYNVPFRDDDEFVFLDSRAAVDFDMWKNAIGKLG